MAPPRQRTAAPATTTGPTDDSRSEASSAGQGQSHREKPKNTTRKPPLPGVSTRTAGTTSGTGSGSGSGPTSHAHGHGHGHGHAQAQAHGLQVHANANITSAPQEVSIPWSDMPLEILHAYRHAYNLPVASAYSATYSRILLSQGIGLRSPTSIAALRAQSQSQSQSQSRSQAGDRRKRKDGGIIGQNRVGKEQLALAVRRHFNSAGLAEQETIARFLYKVREEGKGRQFRLRFLP